MKKLIVLLSMLLLLCISYSQIPGNLNNSYSSSQRSIGIKGGLNFASLSGEDVDDFDSKTGFIFGGFATYPINEQFSFQPEVMFTMKGAKYEYSDSDGDEYMSEKNIVSLNYLEMPLLGVMNIPMQATFDPKLYFGPSLAINLSATSEYEYEYEDYYVSYSESGEEDLEDVNGLEFGLIFGGALEFNSLILDLRYNIGLSKIFSDDDYIEISNRVFSLMLGYKL